MADKQEQSRASCDRTYLAVEKILPHLEVEPSLSASTRAALVDLVSAFERDKYDQINLEAHP